MIHMPARNSGNLETYNTHDYKPISGWVYYRLKTVDIDGSSKLSSVVTIHEAGNKEQLQLVNNPVHDRIQLLTKEGVSGNFHYVLYGTGGQIVLQGNINADSSPLTLQIPLSGSYPAGTYFLLVGKDQYQFSFKLEKQ
jgi:hypothetical protein